MNLGLSTIKFEANGGSKEIGEREFTHNFQVQEFRRPEFEVATKAEASGPLFVGDHAEISVAANYFAGGPLPDAEVKWQVESKPTNFTPPNRGDFTFGKWIPWWDSSSDGDEENTETFNGRTDANGGQNLTFYSDGKTVTTE